MSAGLVVDPDLPRSALIEGFSRWAPGEDLQDSPVPGLSFFRDSAPTKPHAGIYEPSLVMVLQGRKKVVLGQDAFDVDPSCFIISSLDLPVVAHVVEASPDHPHLTLLLRIDLSDVRQLIVDMNLPNMIARQPARAFVMGPTTFELLDAVLRLARLIDQPEDIPLLSKQIQREVLYRLLKSEQGARLCQMAFAQSHGFWISQIVTWLKEHFREPLRVEQLAERVGMAVSTVHHHFRITTGMSPVQYQKNLRLRDARRMMLAENVDVGTAALSVGYESQSQFTREYRRMFGKSPKQDITSLREASQQGGEM